MNHAVFCVTPIARPSSWELMPFRALAIIQIAGSHLFRPMGESSKRVPALKENCFRHFEHFQILRVFRNMGASAPQWAQATPLGQRESADSASAKPMSA